jgi:hypothetical protein
VAQDFLEAGNAALLADRFADALIAYRDALRLSPARAEIFCNIGHAAHLLGEFSTEIAMLEQAIALDPGLVDAHTNLGVTSLLLGDFRRGWQECEWRILSPAAARRGAYPYRDRIPRWQGEPFPGKRLVVARDQGLGDFIQMMRLLPHVKERGGSVVIEVTQPLAALLDDRRDVEVRVVREVERPMKDVDLYVPLMSLPHLFEIDAATIPNDVPYVAVDPERLERWRPRLQSEARLRVAIVWSGNPAHPDDRHRSCSLQDFAALGALDDVAFFSLQKGRDEALQRCGDFEVLALGPELRDFADTAAVIAQVDLTIGVDTAVTHLAGALGKPVWTLLPFVPDWRWMLERDDTPWYPTMRLFRQDRGRSWAAVFERVAEALKIIERG